MPLRRTDPERTLFADLNPKWKEITWGEALDDNYLASNMRSINETFL